MSGLTRSLCISTFAVWSVLVVACGSDDGAQVREIGVAEGSETSDVGAGSASASGPSAASVEDAAAAGDPASDGGYDYASNVSAHRLVVKDICGIGDLADNAAWAEIAAVYTDGVNSVNSDGSVRSIGGFAATGDRLHGLADYYGEATPIDTFVRSALDGTGVFAGQSDAVRGQGVEKGMQNQAMVAWTVHELNSALAKAEAADFDVAEGAVHNWDEAWAFYRGAEPGCSPYATGNSRAANFDTMGSDGETAKANENILAAMVAGRDALLAEDAAGASAARADVMANLVVIYSQAAIRYASVIEDDLLEGDSDAAKVHQAEGFAFWRVIEAYAADAGADVDTINAIYDLAAEPAANGTGDDVRAALRPAWEALGIAEPDIGELS